MKKLALLLTVLIAFGTIGFAFEIPTSESGFERIKTTINEKADQIPGIKTILGTEKINLDLELEDGSISSIGIETERGKIKNIKQGKIETLTIHTHVSQATLKEIMESEDPLQTALDMINSGKIKLEAKRFWSKLKIGFIKISMRIISFIRRIVNRISIPAKPVKEVPLEVSPERQPTPSEEEEIPPPEEPSLEGLADLDVIAAHNQHQQQYNWDDTIDITIKNKGNVPAPIFSYKIIKRNSLNDEVSSEIRRTTHAIEPYDNYVISLAHPMDEDHSERFICQYTVVVDIDDEVEESDERASNWKNANVWDCEEARPDLTVGEFKISGSDSRTFSVEIINTNWMHLHEWVGYKATLFDSNGNNFVGEAVFESPPLTSGIYLWRRNETRYHQFVVPEDIAPRVCKIITEIDPDNTIAEVDEKNNKGEATKDCIESD